MSSPAGLEKKLILKNKTLYIAHIIFIEAGPVDSYYYNLPNGKKVWLKNNVVLRKT